MSYWALAHPPGKPDFHHPDCFALELPAARRRMKFGIDRLLADPALREPLEGKRVALLAHPASVTADLTHSLDALDRRAASTSPPPSGRSTACAATSRTIWWNWTISPIRAHGIPVFSLYGEVRRPTGQSMGTFDVILVDLQDLGCRIYTFITTLLYVLEAAAQHGKAVWVLDRPNPAGRPVEGLTLRPGWESFVGAGPMPMRHGLTLGELGRWFVETMKLDVDYRVIEMEGYEPDAAPGFGWPPRADLDQPQPQRRQPVDGARLCRHGDARRHDPVGGAGHDPPARAVRRARHRRRARVIAEMRRLAPDWLRGLRAARDRVRADLPQACRQALQRRPHPRRKAASTTTRPSAPGGSRRSPSRRSAGSIPDYDLWRDFPYEYEFGKLAIDVINGGPALREWVDDRGGRARRSRRPHRARRGGLAGGAPALPDLPRALTKRRCNT